MFLLTFEIGSSSHFRGGIFMVRPKPGGATREVSWHWILSIVDRYFANHSE